MRKITIKSHRTCEVYEIKWEGGKAICITERHLELMATIVQSIPTMVSYVCPKTMSDLFGLHGFQSSFQEDWRWNFESFKGEFNHRGDFGIRINVPKNSEQVLDFWNHLYYKMDSVYYASAVAAVINQNNMLHNVDLFKKYWMKESKCPFFKISNYSHLDCLKYKFKDLGNFIYDLWIVEEVQDLEYTKYLRKRDSEKLNTIFNQPQTQIAYA